jgi:hypothetical protein
MQEITRLQTALNLCTKLSGCSVLSEMRQFFEDRYAGIVQIYRSHVSTGKLVMKIVLSNLPIHILKSYDSEQLKLLLSYYTLFMQ